TGSSGIARLASATQWIFSTATVGLTSRSPTGSRRRAMRSARLCTTPTESWRRSLASELIDGLFAQYAAAYSRGERPDAAEFLELAGPGAPKLSRLIDAFLARAP